MARHGTLSVALRIARVSSPSLANARTALVSLFAIPVLEVLLLVAIVASVGSADVVTSAYAAVLVGFGLAIVGGAVGIVTRDRQTGVLLETLQHKPLNPVYWVSKVAVPLTSGAAVAVASALTVFALDGEHSARALLAALCLLVPVAVGASLVAVGVAMLSLGFSDPYLVANLVQGVIPLGAGVVAPLAAYPAVLGMLAQLLPFTGVVEALRSIAVGDASGVWLLLVQDAAVSAAWCGLGLVASRYVLAALRSGKRSEDIW